MFNAAIDSKLRGCDLVRLRVVDVHFGDTIRLRTTIVLALCLESGVPSTAIGVSALPAAPQVVIIPLHLYLLAKEMSQPDSAQRSKACALLQQGRLLKLRDLTRAGIGPETMARLVREGVAVRPARGLYQLADTALDPRHTLAEASALVPKGVVCLTSALQFHELTLQMPSAVWIAIDRASWRPKVDHPAIRFVRFSGSSLIAGVERHRIEGVDVPVYEPAKTVVDCFRYRNKIGLDIALEGLKEGLRRRRVTPDQLWRFAQTGRVWSVMRPYVEAIVADGA